MNRKSNRIVKLPHGNGCILNDNCFNCQVKPDCKCNQNKVDKMRNEYINIGLVWANDKT